MGPYGADRSKKWAVKWAGSLYKWPKFKWVTGGIAPINGVYVPLLIAGFWAHFEQNEWILCFHVQEGFVHGQFQHGS